MDGQLSVQWFEDTSMNVNKIVTDRFSNPDSEQMYKDQWPNEPETYRLYYDEGAQCGGCSFFAEFNLDYGLCCNAKSRHHLETVFEHFTCPVIVRECWGPHSFTEDEEFHCRCGGEDIPKE